MINFNIPKPFAKIGIIILTVFAFSVAEARKVPGRIIDNDGNTISVIFKIPSGFLSSKLPYEKIQFRIVYFDKANNRKVLKPDQAQRIIFTNKGEEIVMVSRINTIALGSIFSNPTHIFLRLKIDGRLKLFNYYSSSTSFSPGINNTVPPSSTTLYFSNLVLQLGDRELFIPRGIGFRKKMTEYLRDCPEVVSLIENRELRKGDLEAIVMQYNQTCSGQ